MRNIAEIIADDKNGKLLSQTERQIAVAYIQGKYDAVRELKIYNNSNTNEVLDKIRAEIENRKAGDYACFNDDEMQIFVAGLNTAIDIIDKYNAKPKNIKSQDIEMQATDFLAEARACAEKDDDIER